MVQTLKSHACGLLKQLRTPALLRVRDMDKIAQAFDRVFKHVGVENPLRKVHDYVEMQRMKTLEHQRGNDPFIRKLGEFEIKNPDEAAKLMDLMERESRFQRAGDLPLNKQGFRTSGDREVWRNAQHPDLERDFNALSTEAKDLRADMYDFTEKEHAALAHETGASRLLKEAGIDDTAMVDRILKGTETEADRRRIPGNEASREAVLEGVREAGELNKIVGPYTPFIRRGGYAVTGLYKTPGMAGAKKLNENTYEFASKADARAAAVQQHGTAEVKSHYVDGNGERFKKVTEMVTKDGQPVLDDQGQPRTYTKDVAYKSTDPGVSQRWAVHVERGYLSLHETYRDALAHEEGLRAKGEHEKTDVQNKRYQPRTDSITLAQNFAGYEARLKRNPLYENMSPTEKLAVKQVIAENYLHAISATRVRNSRLNRKNIAGASLEMTQNYMDYSQDTSARKAQMEFGPKIDAEMVKAKDAIGLSTETSKAVNAGYSEFAKRLDQMKDGGFALASGQMGPGMHRLMSWSYMARLATPGFTIRNLTQPGLFTLPTVGARHGFAATGRAMLKVYSDINAGKTLVAGLKDTGKAIKGALTDPSTLIGDIRGRLKETREQQLIDYLAERGRVDPDAGFQIAEFLSRAKGANPDYFGIRKDNKVTDAVTAGLNAADKGLHWMEEVSRQMPRAAEAINRTVTGLTAYRMEFKKTGDHQKAMEYADDVVKNTQFVYSDTNKPAFQRNPWARAAFQFKQFGKSTYEFLGRNIATAISREADPQMRSEARKQLGALFVTHTMVAGALGLPWEPVRALLTGAKFAGFTNKEWDDVEDGIRRALTGVGNLAGLDKGTSKAVGEAMARGLPRLLGIDMSPGLGIDNMLLFSSPKSGTDRDMDNNMKAWLFQLMTGAPGSLVMQGFEGARDFMHGDYAKGFEKTMPLKIGSDLIKAGVGLSEGKVNNRGRETQPPYTAAQALTKAMGIPVAADAERGTYAHQVYQQGQEKSQERTKLLQAYVAAKTPEARQAASAAARAGGIKGDELARALTREQSAGKRVINGVETNIRTRQNARYLSDVYNLRRE